MPIFVLMARVVRIPGRIGISEMSLVRFARLVPVFWCSTKCCPREKDHRGREQHRDVEMLRADLIQDERREYENRQYEIQHDDFESRHGCTLAAGELEASVAPQAWARAGA